MYKQLISDIAFDLGIKSYQGESIDLYCSRVVYSGISLWMKYILLDRMILEDESEIKTKNYHYRRSSEILNEYLNLFPAVKKWMCPRDNVNPIHEIRNRLIAADEIIEVDLAGNITLAKPKKLTIDRNISRLIDLTSEISEFKYVGITKIMNEQNKNDVTLLSESSLDIVKEFINPLYYSVLPTTNFDYELFNPMTKHKFNNDWLDNGNINMELNLIRKRTDIENYWDYVLVLNQSDKLYQYPINDELIKQGFHIRLMLGLRKMYGNTVKARFKKNGDIVELTLDINLPRYEQSFLTTYSWPKRHIIDNWSFIVPIEIWDVIAKMLQTLGFEMEMF